ncbi:hypothetical protein MFIFM68171_09688 [Madurella fahalii]|uniref:Uncharacterized protein n=1 Tax=Madurella fahalii TaxID=1157608 RepID=A0ABQ0GP14_9PEZI
MLPLRTFSIRKLLPRKKHDGLEDNERSYFYHGDHNDMDTLSRLKSRWPPMMPMKRPKPSIDIRRSEDSQGTICILPLPNTPQSSATSVCSWDNGMAYATPPRRPDRNPLASPLASPQGSSQMSPLRRPQRSPLLPHQQCEGLQAYQGKSPVSANLHQGYVQLTPPSSPPQHALAIERPIGWPDAVPSAPAASCQPLSSPEFIAETWPAEILVKGDKGGSSQDVRQLIQMADDVSKPGQSYFTEGKLLEWQLDKFPKPKYQSPLSPPARRKSQRRSQGSVKSVKSPTKIGMNRAARPELDVTHVKKGTVTSRASMVNQGPDIGQGDCKTLKAQPQEQGNGNKQEWYGQGDGQGRELEEQSPPFPVLQPDSPITKFCNDKESEEKEGGETLPVTIVADGGLPTQAGPAGSPNPQPVKLPLRRRLRGRQLPSLPPIPESVVTGPGQAALSPSSILQLPESANNINSDDYVFLDSTPFTLTMPAFRHGQIRLAKADLPIGKLAAAVDNTLDWTVFQMAILGGVGDFFSEPTDYSRPSEADLDELDGIISWFGSFGFQSAGALVGASWPPRAPVGQWTPVSSPPFPNSTCTSIYTSKSSPWTTPDSRSSGRINLPVPSDVYNGRSNPKLNDSMASRRFPDGLAGARNGNENRDRGRDSNGNGSSTFKHYQSASSTTFRLISGVQREPSKSSSSGSRNHTGLAIDSSRQPSIDSIQSLPQSPMMDLVITHDVDDNEYLVPMGFNLSHDLGDFLTWHTEHVSGAEFYDPDCRC